MKKFINGILIVASLFILSPFSSFADGNYTSIMYTNDLHANINVIGGIIKDKNSLWIDGGDLIHGSELALLTQEEVVVDLVNDSGLDILIPGNHEFDYGYKRLLELKQVFKGEIIVANVYSTKTKERLFKPYTIKNINGKKILIIGLTTEEINTNIYINQWSKV